MYVYNICIVFACIQHYISTSLGTNQIQPSEIFYCQRHQKLHSQHQLFPANLTSSYFYTHMYVCICAKIFFMAWLCCIVYLPVIITSKIRMASMADCRCFSTLFWVNMKPVKLLLCFDIHLSTDYCLLNSLSSSTVISQKQKVALKEQMVNSFKSSNKSRQYIRQDLLMTLAYRVNTRLLQANTYCLTKN